MITHHFVTILLIVFSYLLNFSRIGSVILLIHDAADIFLESAKVFNYISKARGREWAKHVCDIMFALFAITFFVTRLVFFPRYVIYDVLYVSPITFNNDWFGYWTFAALLIILECLHIFWFYLVLKMVKLLKRYKNIRTNHLHRCIVSLPLVLKRMNDLTTRMKLLEKIQENLLFLLLIKVKVNNEL